MSKIRMIDGRMVLLLSFQLIFMSVLGFYIGFKIENSSVKTQNSWDKVRETANKLKMVGVLKESINLYKSYLENAPIGDSEKAEVAYNLAEMLEKEGMLEAALSYYYQVEVFGKSGKLVDESKDKLVTVLERLKKFGAVKYALKSSTTLDDKKEDPKSGGDVIAKVGDTSIYLHEINAALDQLPKQYREQFSAKDKKLEFVKKFVADEMMFKKAQRMGYESDPELLKQLDQMKKMLLVQKIIKEEVSGKIKIDEKDAENYFIAHQDNYTQKKARDVSYVKISGKEKASEFEKGLKKIKTIKDLPKEFEAKSGTLFENESFMELSNNYLEKVWKTKKNSWSEPVISQGNYYYFFVKNESPEKKYDFKEIKNQVLSDYRGSKEQELYQNLIEESMKTENVQFFPERIL